MSKFIVWVFIIFSEKLSDQGSSLSRKWKLVYVSFIDAKLLKVKNVEYSRAVGSSANVSIL